MGTDKRGCLHGPLRLTGIHAEFDCPISLDLSSLIRTVDHKDLESVSGRNVVGGLNWPLGLLRWTRIDL